MFRQIELATLLAVLGNLTLVELVILALANTMVLLSLSARWWLILLGRDKRVTYFRLSLYRLAAFSISYFTPGPQFGGEPLQIQLLRRRHGMSGASAGASVALDKSLELAVNFGFLLFGVVVALTLGLLPGSRSLWLLLAALGLLLIPVTHLALASRGKRPVAAFLQRLPASLRRLSFMDRLFNVVRATEQQVTDYLSAQPFWVLAALGASAISWLLLIGEYWLMAQFLGLDISVWMAIAALTAARLAILLPAPGGLGTLEASQVLAFTALTNSPVSGAALALVIRGRDLLFGGLGLLLVGYFGGVAVTDQPEPADDRIRQAGGPNR